LPWSRWPRRRRRQKRSEGGKHIFCVSLHSQAAPFLLYGRDLKFPCPQIEYGRHKSGPVCAWSLLTHVLVAFLHFMRSLVHSPLPLTLLTMWGFQFANSRWHPLIKVCSFMLPREFCSVPSAAIAVQCPTCLHTAVIPNSRVHSSHPVSCHKRCHPSPGQVCFLTPMKVSRHIQQTQQGVRCHS
jgi:hypothetical protein